ncbi:hypothetical protein DLM78_10610 [Leptospira stimsonii]|uniref:Uncharacterized protein n=1 Tax=Leptospira stimsonii TaxID=2202203 RepID=A0A8B3CQ32_9LEPT|nr:hypothetical protein DLM78_10610 [Leptospira stimsonii]
MGTLTRSRVKKDDSSVLSLGLARLLWELLRSHRERFKIISRKDRKFRSFKQNFIFVLRFDVRIACNRF